MQIIFSGEDTLKHGESCPSGYFSDMLTLPISVQTFITAILVLIIPAGTVFHSVYSKLHNIYHAVLIVHQLTQISSSSRHSIVDNEIKVFIISVRNRDFTYAGPQMINITELLFHTQHKGSNKRFHSYLSRIKGC